MTLLGVTNTPAATKERTGRLGPPMIVEPSSVGAAPTGEAAGPVMSQRSTFDNRGPKHRRLVRIDEDDDEDEAAPTLILRPRSRPDVAPGDSGRVAEDPPAAHVEQA